MTSTKIIKLLKKEALAGRTIICTVHQPNSESFQLFNRLLLLHDGYQIYQGPTADILPYLKSLDVRMGKYQNIPEFMIKMAIAPQLIRYNLTLDELKSNYVVNQSPVI